MVLSSLLLPFAISTAAITSLAAIGTRSTAVILIAALRPKLAPTKLELTFLHCLLVPLTFVSRTFRIVAPMPRVAHTLQFAVMMGEMVAVTVAVGKTFEVPYTVVSC